MISHFSEGANGGVLACDVGGLAPVFADCLRAKRYRLVSAEIYDEPPAGLPPDPQTGAPPTGKMLRRVAFLGGDVPEVKGLGSVPLPEGDGESITGVNLFAAGDYRGKDYSEADLADIGRNFALYSAGDDPAFPVPAVVGHSEDQSWLADTGQPAAGWVTACSVGGVGRPMRYSEGASSFDPTPPGVMGSGACSAAWSVPTLYGTWAVFSERVDDEGSYLSDVVAEAIRDALDDLASGADVPGGAMGVGSGPQPSAVGDGSAAPGTSALEGLEAFAEPTPEQRAMAASRRRLASSYHQDYKLDRDRLNARDVGHDEYGGVVQNVNPNNSQSDIARANRYRRDAQELDPTPPDQRLAEDGDDPTQQQPDEGPEGDQKRQELLDRLSRAGVDVTSLQGLDLEGLMEMVRVADAKAGVPGGSLGEGGFDEPADAREAREHYGHAMAYFEHARHHARRFGVAGAGGPAEMAEPGRSRQPVGQPGAFQPTPEIDDGLRWRDDDSKEEYGQWHQGILEGATRPLTDLEQQQLRAYRGQGPGEMAEPGVSPDGQKRFDDFGRVQQMEGQARVANRSGDQQRAGELFDRAGNLERTRRIGATRMPGEMAEDGLSDDERAVRELEARAGGVEAQPQTLRSGAYVGDDDFPRGADKESIDKDFAHRDLRNARDNQDQVYGGAAVLAARARRWLGPRELPPEEMDEDQGGPPSIDEALEGIVAELQERIDAGEISVPEAEAALERAADELCDDGGPPQGEMAEPGMGPDHRKVYDHDPALAQLRQQNRAHRDRTVEEYLRSSDPANADARLEDYRRSHQGNMAEKVTPQERLANLHATGEVGTSATRGHGHPEGLDPESLADADRDRDPAGAADWHPSSTRDEWRQGVKDAADAQNQRFQNNGRPDYLRHLGAVDQRLREDLTDEQARDAGLMGEDAPPANGLRKLDHDAETAYRAGDQDTADRLIAQHGRLHASQYTQDKEKENKGGAHEPFYRNWRNEEGFDEAPAEGDAPQQQDDAPPDPAALDALQDGLEQAVAAGVISAEVAQAVLDAACEGCEEDPSAPDYDSVESRPGEYAERPDGLRHLRRAASEAHRRGDRELAGRLDDQADRLANSHLNQDGQKATKGTSLERTFDDLRAQGNHAEGGRARDAGLGGAHAARFPFRDPHGRRMGGIDARGLRGRELHGASDEELRRMMNAQGTRTPEREDYDEDDEQPETRNQREEREYQRWKDYWDERDDRTGYREQNKHNVEPAGQVPRTADDRLARDRHGEPTRRLQKVKIRRPPDEFDEQDTYAAVMERRRRERASADAAPANAPDYVTLSRLARQRGRHADAEMLENEARRHGQRFDEEHGDPHELARSAMERGGRDYERSQLMDSLTGDAGLNPEEVDTLRNESRRLRTSAKAGRHFDEPPALLAEPRRAELRGGGRRMSNEDLRVIRDYEAMLRRQQAEPMAEVTPSHAPDEREREIAEMGSRDAAKRLAQGRATPESVRAFEKGHRLYQNARHGRTSSEDVPMAEDDEADFEGRVRPADRSPEHQDRLDARRANRMVTGRSQGPYRPLPVDSTGRMDRSERQARGFDERPMAEGLPSSGANDDAMPPAFRNYRDKRSPAWWRNVTAATNRVSAPTDAAGEYRPQHGTEINEQLDRADNKRGLLSREQLHARTMGSMPRTPDDEADDFDERRYRMLMAKATGRMAEDDETNELGPGGTPARRPSAEELAAVNDANRAGWAREYGHTRGMLNPVGARRPFTPMPKGSQKQVQRDLFGTYAGPRERRAAGQPPARHAEDAVSIFTQPPRRRFAECFTENPNHQAHGGDMNQQDIQTIDRAIAQGIARAVPGILKQLTAGTNKTTEEAVKRLAEETAKAEKFTEQQKNAVDAADIGKVLDELGLDGKVWPAERAGELETIMGLDNTVVRKFSEGEKTVEMTARARHIARLKARRSRFGPQMAAGTAGTAGGETADAEVAKVEAHYESFAEDGAWGKGLRSHTSKDEFVGAFKARRKREPATTAESFLNPRGK